MNSTTQLQVKRNQNAAAMITLEPTCTIYLDNKKVASSKAYFDSLLLEAVDSTFSMLGDLNKQALYFILKNSYGVSIEAIPHCIEVVTKMLEQVFGQGALLLEAQIMETLHRRVPSFKFSPKQEELSFLGYLESLRSFF
jgi:hypothetical protein